MATADRVDRLIEQFRLAQDEFLKGNAEPTQKLFSHREDAILCNPLSPPARGLAQVAQTIEHASSLCRDGNLVAVETVAKYVTPELAYLLEIQRGRAKSAGSEDITPFALRVTMIFRPEDGVWKIVHRHAHAITTAQPVDSIIQR